MAADQILVVVLVLACAIAVGWMSISSHRADARRLDRTPTETGPPGASRSQDDHA